MQTSPPGPVGPLGHNENRVRVIALNDVKDLAELVVVGQDERHFPSRQSCVRAFTPFTCTESNYALKRGHVAFGGLA